VHGFLRYVERIRRFWKHCGSWIGCEFWRGFRIVPFLMFGYWLPNEIWMIDRNFTELYRHQACCLLHYVCKITSNNGIQMYLSGCNCGFEFEEKYWRIDGFGEKRYKTVDLHTLEKVENFIISFISPVLWSVFHELQHLVSPECLLSLWMFTSMSKNGNWHYSWSFNFFAIKMTHLDALLSFRSFASQLDPKLFQRVIAFWFSSTKEK